MSPINNTNMDSSANDSHEPSVDEGAFWHANMDLYYGYLAGEVVEVEHEPNKYWLAMIRYCFKHLVLLKWVGNYGNEFWVDTALTNAATSSSGTLNDFSNPKRLFPLGYHLQSQLKSQFTLEKPSKILLKPSLYNPSKDPYADIKTIDDLLVHEIDEQNSDDAFAIKSTSDTASIALAKCKTKINYGQEDQDELEAALQSLTGLEESDESGGRPENSQAAETNHLGPPSISKGPSGQPDGENQAQTAEKTLSEQDTVAPIKPLSETNDDSRKNKSDPECAQKSSDESENLSKDNDLKLDAKVLELCKKIQASAINKGRYLGVHSATNEHNDEVFFSKPKQFFDVGGANHERLFVPGTLLEVCHMEETESGCLDLSQWFAFVIKNVGGRLTLRWFICDEPKFKQGRLEMKCSRSRFVLEEADQSTESDNPPDADCNKIVDSLDMNGSVHKQQGISSKSITFSLHFCDPKIHNILSAKSINRNYKLPNNIYKYILDSHGQDFLDNITETQIEYVFDARRMNLDRDRPLIDHILTCVQSSAPTYLDLIFAPKDQNSKREVLMSSPKITKLLNATVKRELGPGVFEVHSEPLSETGEVLKMIYPYDSSCAILPKDWANDHKDCLSINSSRNPSPTVSTNTSKELTYKRLVAIIDAISEEEDGMKLSQNEEHCFKCRSRYSRNGGSFKRVTCDEMADLVSTFGEFKTEDFDELDPTCWMHYLRSKELEASMFHCCINYNQETAVESRFKVMDLLEVVHPSSDSIICMGRIRKVVFPLIWIQLSSDCYTVVPFNSTNIYPSKWCEAHNHKLISLLPPRKRCVTKTSPQQTTEQNRRKKAKLTNNDNLKSKEQKSSAVNSNELYEKEHFDLSALNDRQAGIDYILNEKSAYIKIFFNHKCFTGPSLSKSKICSLPQYVGPGPMRLVIEEVVTKVISVAYVPPRILNDLSSKSFEDLLVERNLTNTISVEFKAKYQKRVHRDHIPVCVNPDDVALYCECICEHIKCCYNLFGLNLYDGDDCPSHCRSLTKSNKFMKRATYYREKARQGDFLSQPGNEANSNGGKKVSSQSHAGNAGSGSMSRAKYTGRGSSESTTSSNMSSSDQNNGKVSPSFSRAEALTYEMKENSLSPDAWTIDDVSRYLDACQLSIFKNYMKSEGIDGQALLLLDKATIEEHFQQEMKSEITQEEVNKLCQLVELIRARV